MIFMTSHLFWTSTVSGDPDSIPMELLRNRSIVILRIVLISRSADLATLQPYLFTSKNRFYVRFFDKVGKWRNHSVTGRALLIFAEYPKRVCSQPRFFASGKSRLLERLWVLNTLQRWP